MAGILIKWTSANRAALVPGLPVDGDLILTVRNYDVTHGAGGDGDDGGYIVTHGTLQLSF